MKNDKGLKGLNTLRNEALAIATSHGFTDATVGEDAALMHSELSEMLEDHREGKKPTEVWYEEKVLAYDIEGKAILLDGKQATVSVRYAEQYRRKADGGFDYSTPRKMCGIPSELADVIIRVLHFAGKHGIDIEEAVNTKSNYNSSRPFKHGKIL